MNKKIKRPYELNPFAQKPATSIVPTPLVCPHCNGTVAVNVQIDFKVMLAIRKLTDTQFKDLGGKFN